MNGGEKVCHRRPHSSNLISEGLRQPVPHYFLLFSTFLKAGRNTEHIRDQRSNTEHSRGQRRTTEHSRDQNGAQPRQRKRETRREARKTRETGTRGEAGRRGGTQGRKAEATEDTHATGKHKGKTQDENRRHEARKRTKGSARRERRHPKT